MGIFVAKIQKIVYHVMKEVPPGFGIIPIVDGFFAIKFPMQKFSGCGISSPVHPCDGPIIIIIIPNRIAVPLPTYLSGVSNRHKIIVCAADGAGISPDRISIFREIFIKIRALIGGYLFSPFWV